MHFLMKQSSEDQIYGKNREEESPKQFLAAAAYECTHPRRWRARGVGACDTRGA